MGEVSNNVDALRAPPKGKRETAGGSTIKRYELLRLNYAASQNLSAAISKVPLDERA